MEEAQKRLSHCPLPSSYNMSWKMCLCELWTFPTDSLARTVWSYELSGNSPGLPTHHLLGTSFVPRTTQGKIEGARGPATGEQTCRFKAAGVLVSRDPCICQMRKQGLGGWVTRWRSCSQLVEELRHGNRSKYVLLALGEIRNQWGQMAFSDNRVWAYLCYLPSILTGFKSTENAHCCCFPVLEKFSAASKDRAWVQLQSRR